MSLPPLSKEMEDKLEQWVAAKRQRDFETSDRIRAEMKDAGMEDKLEQWVAAKRQRDFETSDRIRAEMKDAGVNPEEYRPPPGKGGGGDAPTRNAHHATRLAYWVVQRVKSA
ncbi:hypothetical protein EMIHUDRAFT_235206 [Emiliania huxleyi CCMP1516]|uniref:Uncharacterized protein n=2 Tax=Emiliania huxleyi TaxID=2903 RepID=A0A0D3JPC3_EMIH1|nr:hypothetical protein EMIHUDRAFT_237787 [Emiliania huxleyi CCMP1516]XP_005780448.1 hypothetical protein EMIHUDRAFT_235206 [Emiliania huxleyi CCMP1516]EOD25358.1 hypothetical protein EMIHUDRAFT_237787 [Emiliania huxleyi CCMP1516]EOD28019.1 hypothetical protein EMIHUDRAFT_235206 [Emiliania huxleyi CCMP1516]|eukprot:XP_005777787.1 hypothetical protein EMIHUDRAFT_237787 [Emiliania huxleyi CCMP1516]